MALQDSRGYQGNTDEEVAAVLKPLSAAAAAAGQPLWTNVELFEAWPLNCTFPDSCGRHPAPMERIAAQLANEDPFAPSRHVAWEWLSSLSPYTSDDTAVLYADYKTYVNGGGVAARPVADDDDALYAYLVNISNWIMTLDVGSNKLNVTGASTQPTSIFINGNVLCGNLAFEMT